MKARKPAPDTPRESAAKPAGHGHPLFDPPDAARPDTRDISFVQVVRGGVHFPKNFTAEELPDLEAVHQIFGGGSFEFIGRDLKNSRITARQSRRIEGKPKPFGTEAEEPARAVAAPSPSSTEDRLFVFGTTVLAPFLLKYLTDSSDERRKSEERQTQMMLAFAQNSSQSSAQMMSQFTALTTGVIAQHQHAAGNIDAKTYLEIYKKGGEEMKAAVEKVAKEGDGGGKSVEALLGGAQIFFAKEAEQAAAEREKHALERTKLEAMLRGQIPYGYSLQPQGQPIAPPPMFHPGMQGMQPQGVPPGAVPVAVPVPAMVAPGQPPNHPTGQQGHGQ